MHKLLVSLMSLEDRRRTGGSFLLLLSALPGVLSDFVATAIQAAYLHFLSEHIV